MSLQAVWQAVGAMALRLVLPVVRRSGAKRRQPVYDPYQAMRWNNELEENMRSGLPRRWFAQR